VRRRTKQSVALLGGAAFVTLMWPGPSSADTSLGGYSGIAQAEAVRIQIYEPTIPIPATPQIDGGIGYTKSATDTGPVSRGTASYLWPGDVVGDGFGVLAGDDSAQYPVQVNSRYPATSSAPATSTAQLTDGNGMTTSSDGFTTRATVTGLGIAGPDTDLLGGLGSGLNTLPGMPTPTNDSPAPSVPLPVSKTLAGLVTMQNVKSNSTVVVGSKSITSTAQTYTSQITLLGGLVTIDGLKVTSKTVSDGTKATTTGSTIAGAVKIAGQDLGLDGTNLVLGGTGSETKLPDIPDAVTTILDKIGISVHFAPSNRTVAGASGSLDATGLVISVDTQPLKDAVNLGGLIGPLKDLLEQIPKLGSSISPLLSLGPKIVFRIADVMSSATAAPAYVYPPITGPTGSTGGAGTGGTVPGTSGNGLGGLGTGNGTGTLPTGNGNVPPTNNTPQAQPAAFGLPGLGSIPRMLILGALALALALGWVFRALGGFILGTGRDCAFGLSTGVPDLRKG
jgi:hypothetical protein